MMRIKDSIHMRSSGSPFDTYREQRAAMNLISRRGDALRRRCAPYAPYMPHTGVLSLYPIHRRVLRRPSIMRMRAQDLCH
ncbi:Protein CBG27077 [Caenorhabditis briggsae]|uniref:Protein CBG27077 n=1 Tax=Caenorhabditis briggsae TaxID=6238 RepID=B6IHF3_CAEBR|nr:Protein CBG27077 [Caenorhabditis briggsae]CAR99333.1 Protein CBG27077 [Caenorhabditis briggsae]